MLPNIPKISREDQANLWAEYSEVALEGFHEGRGLVRAVAEDLQSIESQILTPDYVEQDYNKVIKGTFSENETKILGRVAYLRASVPHVFPADDANLGDIATYPNGDSLR